MGITIKKAPTFLSGNLFLGSFRKANENASKIEFVQNICFKRTMKLKVSSMCFNSSKRAFFYIFRSFILLYIKSWFSNFWDKPVRFLVTGFVRNISRKLT